LTALKFIALFLYLSLQAIPSHALESFPDFSRKPDSQYHLSADIVIEPRAVHPGALFELRVWISLDEGWHIYSMETANGQEDYPTRIRLNDSRFVGQGEWKEPKPKVIFDGALGKMVKTHKNVIEFRRFYWAPRDTKVGSYNLAGIIIYRACDNRICTLPREMGFSTPLEILDPSRKRERPH